MISIIICSRTKTISDNLSENIKNTVGCEYELVIIDNSQNQYSIFEAYNLGIERSTKDYLCFIHDDILFHSLGWGNSINTIFEKNTKIGLIGIAGAKFKTKTPSTWWDSPVNLKAMNLIQHFKNGNIENQSLGFNSNPLQEVVTIDGVFMVLRKNTNIIFSSHLTGFHNYDMNLCFECHNKGIEIVVTNEILLEHFSAGTINGTWVDSTFKIHSLYNNILPLSIIKNQKIKKYEIENTKRFIRLCMKFNRKKIAFSIWKKFVVMHPISKFHFLFIREIIKKGKIV
jgi:hypothetical protein